MDANISELSTEMILVLHDLNPVTRSVYEIGVSLQI